MSEEYDLTDEDLFDELLEEDDIFDELDEAELQELERPAKRLKTSPTADTPNSAHIALAERLLSEKFGYSSFRHEQAGAIQKTLAGENALVIFPTGAGKSLCYQIPAIAFPELDKTEGTRDSRNGGVTIVVSPLIALMKDQVDSLRKRGIAADSIDSTKSWDDVQMMYASLAKSELRILYCAPERLNNEGFIASMKDIPGGIRLVAVDEAHCISEWGHSFRPDYLKVARFVDEIKAERVVCLTATATPRVAEDICKAFSIKEDAVFKTSPYRPNLELSAKSIGTKTDDVFPQHVLQLMFPELSPHETVHRNDERFEELFKFLRANPGPTLVYVALQKQAEICADALTQKGFSAAAFHAGMKTEVKTQIQNDFMASKIQIVCATIAFGMGIDKADIRNVIHWDMANTVEEYSQQIGRAGRDGKTSRCLFMLTASSSYTRELFARGDLPSRESTRGLVREILLQGKGLSVGDVFKISQYSQTRDFDIRQSPLSIIYASLELHFGLVRAITPEYSAYKFEAMPAFHPIMKEDKTPAAQAILKNATKKVKFYAIDVNAAAGGSGYARLSRMDIVGKLNQLNAMGVIKLQTTGIEHRYQILKPLPTTIAEIDAVVDKLYVDMQNRERDALERGREVMELMTGQKCFARGLAEHFGMGLPDGKEKCSHCTFCRTGKRVISPPTPVAMTTAASIQAVLKATNVRDDPRFLARVAFGIKSPRVTQLKLDKHNVFRSLAHHSFVALLREFTKVCDMAQAS